MKFRFALARKKRDSLAKEHQQEESTNAKNGYDSGYSSHLERNRSSTNSKKKRSQILYSKSKDILKRLSRSCLHQHNHSSSVSETNKNSDNKIMKKDSQAESKSSIATLQEKRKSYENVKGPIKNSDNKIIKKDSPAESKGNIATLQEKRKPYENVKGPIKNSDNKIIKKDSPAESKGSIATLQEKRKSYENVKGPILSTYNLSYLFEQRQNNKATKKKGFFSLLKKLFKSKRKKKTELEKRKDSMNEDNVSREVSSNSALQNSSTILKIRSAYGRDIMHKGNATVSTPSLLKVRALNILINYFQDKFGPFIQSETHKYHSIIDNKQ